jgi:hypothetical protein
LLSLFVAVICFVLSLYTSWQWPRYVAMLAILVGALSVFIGVSTAWFGRKHAA